MSLIVTRDCPHCGTKSVAFNTRFEFRATYVESEKLIVATCASCRNGVIFRLHLTRHTADVVLINLIGGHRESGINILDQWPKSEAASIPDNVPENIASILQQAHICFANEAFDAAGVMYRKALEVATKEKAPEKAKLTLDKRIEYLAQEGSLPAEVKDWAHEIRLEGNFAAHAADPLSREQAKTLEQFCEAFMLYVYSMPALVAESRARRSEPLPVQ